MGTQFKSWELVLASHLCSMGVLLEKNQWEPNVRAGSALSDLPVNGSPLRDTQCEPIGVLLAVSLPNYVSRGTTK